MYGVPVFIGIDNYIKILFDTGSIYFQQFRSGMGNTVFFVVFCVPLCIFIPLLLSALLNMKPKGYRLFQSILYMPALFSISAVMIIWSFLLSLSYGPIRPWTGMDIDLKSTQPWAWICIIGVTLWWCIGSNLIVYSAAMGNVDREQLEAAEIDGAGSVIRFFRIIIPNIRYPLFFTTLTTTIAQFNIYGQPLMLTGGGPNHSTRVLMMYIQQNAFGKGTSTAGMSSAMAVLMGVVLMCLSAVQYRIARKVEQSS